jgi:hypothetical protein
MAHASPNPSSLEVLQSTIYVGWLECNNSVCTAGVSAYPRPNSSINTKQLWVGSDLMQSMMKLASFISLRKLLALASISSLVPICAKLLIAICVCSVCATTYDYTDPCTDPVGDTEGGMLSGYKAPYMCHDGQQSKLLQESGLACKP